ncbi:U6 snRNA phosphodiesterase [Paragonimus heterotremus]|uniref:U6 snRNA phosphodiesterase 1 n=1 Tax=Paragonimus heterotremus TaxID=100268 RepID=A0A8J4TFT2_9TREM|nr:U6 snRNA phosphodiesterase [Paragonimus heterotremus]
MALVDYSSSDESDSQSKLELPAFLHSIAADPTRFTMHKDNAELHQMRQRSFAHEVGQWASSIYIDCSLDLCHITSALSTSDALSEQTVWQRFQACEKIHLSLSKTWSVRYHWIDNLVQSLIKSLCSFPSSIILTYLSFLGLCTTRESAEHLSSLVMLVDRSVEAFRGPCYYKSPKFHVSFFWCNGDIQRMNTEVELKQLKSCANAALQPEHAKTQILVDTISCKCGNKLFTIPLSQ